MRTALPVAMRASGLPSRFELSVCPRGTVANEDATAAVFALDAPRPNPSRGAPAVRFSLAEARTQRLVVVRHN